MSKPPTGDILIQRGLKLSHLRLLAALAETSHISLAADRIRSTQPAASRLLAEVERIVGQPVHHRTGRGMSLTAVGQALATRAQRIQMELRDAARDMSEVASGTSGHVRIGAVTGPAIDRVLPTLRNARLTAPQVTVEVVVSPSDLLCEQLLAGRLDFVIGRLPEGPTRDLFTLTPIATEPVSLVVRKGHPLANHPNPKPEDLLAYDWVMPPPDSLLSRAVHARLHASGMPSPPQRLSTASFLLIFALLQQSNAIAPLARAVVTSFSASPDAPYTELAIDLGIEVEPFGLVTRAGAILPPVAARLAREIQNMVTL
ncbi:LysR substrate-binding domain-containing protein [Cypionkella sp.]|uniref:LysR substrate-binding domain-containing protein n=1 Tax=Cypionkella sp. TaxID=2811411 RepID=UPI002602F783|nr:LysR substrate-binding domain-containing protein [Cypionkella sp.]MDB5664411.1 LysR family transcriptional regulator [Cypionkella sp.]